MANIIFGGILGYFIFEFLKFRILSSVSMVPDQEPRNCMI